MLPKPTRSRSHTDDSGEVLQIIELLNGDAESSDNLEQYTRRPNLRILGVPETGEDEDTDTTVLAVITDKMGVTLHSRCTTKRGATA